MSSFFSPPSPPPPPPPPVVRPAITRKQPRLADEGVRKARDEQARKAKRAAALGGTLLTGPGGLTSTANLQKKTLLGQ